MKKYLAQTDCMDLIEQILTDEGYKVSTLLDLEELPPNARVLTREEVLAWAERNNLLKPGQFKEVDELFGSEDA